jgi:cyclopropane-fatty-acyl-phospholipid synthase
VFLNHGILRPKTVAPDAETLLLERSVFPGGELVHLSDVCREAERAGFEITDVENLRPHYALTCRAWIDALRRNETECVRLAGSQTYRTCLLFLAGSAVNFEDGYTAVCQLLMHKRDHPRPRRMSRDYIYPPSPLESQLL